MHWLTLPWSDMFTFSRFPLEIIIRGVLVYLALVLLLRLVLKREGGALSFTDILTVVLLGDASQQAMANEHKSIADGLLLVTTILLCNLGLDYLQFHFDWIEKLLSPPTLDLVRDGRLLRRNMRHELVREEEIMSHAHAAGIEHLADIRRAYMEGNGEITIIPRQPSSGTSSSPHKKHPLS